MICKYFLQGDSEIHWRLKTIGLNRMGESRIRVEWIPRMWRRNPEPLQFISISFKNMRYGFQIISTKIQNTLVQFSSFQSLSHVQLFATPSTAARQVSLSITNSQSLPRLMSIESVMPSNHLILCHHLLFLPSIFPSIRVFSNESALCIRWPKYWSFSFIYLLKIHKTRRKNMTWCSVNSL